MIHKKVKETVFTINGPRPTISLSPLVFEEEEKTSII
jgi:hypothetical protein